MLVSEANRIAQDVDAVMRATRRNSLYSGGVCQAIATSLRSSQ